MEDALSLLLKVFNAGEPFVVYMMISAPEAPAKATALTKDPRSHICRDFCTAEAPLSCFELVWCHMRTARRSSAWTICALLHSREDTGFKPVSLPSRR